MSKYLFLSPHCDDATISCGGTMIKLSEAGHLVYHLSLSNCENWDLVAEFTASNNQLNIPGYCHQFKHRTFHEQRAELTKMLHACKPDSDFVVTTSIHDRHTDHRVAAEESLRVFNCNIATYGGPWNMNETPNYFHEISEAQLQKKIEALKCYKSQAHRSYMSEEFIRAQAVYNGIKCGKKYAEAFKIERYIQ